MHRTIGDSYGLDAGKRIFRQENPPTYKATQATFDTMNALQEEIANAIEAAGIVLNAPSETIASMTQLNQAIQARVAAEAGVRNANDRVANGDLVRDQLNRVNEQTNLATLLASLRSLAPLRPNGFYMTPLTATPLISVLLSIGGASAVNGAAFMQLSSGISKRINDLWAAGTGNGGRAGALTNGTWYHMFVIRNNTAPYTVDAGFDASPTAANLLAASGYTWYRRVGSVYYIDGTSGIRPFIVRGDTVLWTPTVVDALAQAQPVSPTVNTLTLSVPPVPVTAILNVVGTHLSAAWRINLWDGLLGSTISAVNGVSVAGAAGVQSCTGAHLLTENSTIYATEVAAGSPSRITLGTRGYIDERIDF